MPRFRGDILTTEAFLVDILTPASVQIAEFHPGDRSGNSGGASWTDLTLNEYIWEWEKGRPSILTLEVDDLDREFFDQVKRGDKARLALDNEMKDCVLSLDMETLEAATDLQDLSLNGNKGVITGATDLAGYHGRALDFNGTSDDVTVTDDPSLDFTSGFTFCITVTPDIDTATGNRTFVSKTNEFTIRQIDDVLHFYVYDGVDLEPHVSASNVFNAGTTTRIVCTADGTDHKIYVNGTEVATLARSFLPPASANDLEIGTGGAEYFDGKLDEVAAFIRAFTAADVSKWNKHRSRAPRYYFDGRIRKKTHQDGVTIFTCVDNMVDAVDQEIFDLIFEGMETDDTTKPSFVYKKFIPIKPADANHDTTYAQFVDVDGNNLTTAPAPTDKVYGPILEYPDQSETQQTGEVSMWWDTGSSPSLRTWYTKFKATAKKVKRISVNMNPKSVSLATIRINIVKLETDVNGDLTTRTIIVFGAFTTAAEDAYRWYSVDFSGGSYELETDADYWISIEDPGNANWTLASPAFWGVGDGSREVFMESPASTWFKKNVGLDVVIEMEDNYIPLDSEHFSVVKADNADLIVGDFDPSEIVFTVTQIIDNFFRATYFYSKGDKKVSDVIERILAKVGLTAIFTNTGGLSSGSTTEPLGLYVPQGGTAMEHVTNLAALAGDRPRFVPPNFVQFQHWPEPTDIRNSSFELTDSAGNFLDWTFVQQVGTGTIQQITVGSSGGSGDFGPRMGITGNGQTDAEMRLYQDVEDFDPVASGIDGNNLSFWMHRNQSWTGFTFQVTIYDYGSFNNPKTFVISTPALGVWEERRINIERTHFRISMEFLYSGAALGITRFANFDDVFIHYENLRSFFVVDAGKQDADYNSGFLPGTRPGSSPIGVHLLDDYRTGPKIMRETSRKMVNAAIVLGKRTDFGFSEPVLAISKNTSRANLYGDRARLDRQESVTTVEDAYKRAKQRVRFDATFRTSLDMVGQYPFLSARMIRLFFPNHGIPTATTMEVTGIVIDSKRTLLRFNRSITEQFEDVEKLQEKQSEMAAAFSVDLTESLLYFTTVDLPTTIDPSAVALARLKDEAGATSNNIFLEAMDTRDGTVDSVWRMVIGLRDGPTFNTTGTDVWTQLQIRNGSDGFLADIPFDQEFAKLENQWIVIWIYAQ
ncbi:MAG: LamG domain-containing protein [Candidatus Binatia bacterium]